MEKIPIVKENISEYVIKILPLFIVYKDKT